MQNIEDLMNNSFFKYFKEISDIPRESGNEKEISDYLLKFAKNRKLDVIQDQYLNVIIKKSCTKGYENIPPIILQGHMDMVCVKNNNSKHDFKKDPIKLKIIDDMIYADNTTLGSDDGVALAYSLAILDSKNLNHPDIEVIITTEEETSMRGAINLDTSSLNGKVMINLDSDKHDKLLVSSTGGIITMQNIEIEWVDKKDEYIECKIAINGLIGGHSGEEIHKERGNANKILARILNAVNSKFDIQLADISGGTSSNAIAREASAIICIPEKQYNQISNLINQISEMIKFEFNSADKNLSITIQKTQNKNTDKVFSSTILNKLISLIMLMPNGVQSMSVDIAGLVESSNNIGVISVKGKNLFIEGEIRSCVKSRRYEIEERIKIICNLLGISYSTRDPYPEWNYNKDSIIRQIFKDSYKKLYDREMEVEAVHAGLETGIFLEKMPYLDVVSYGPNAYELHNPTEHMSISSCLKAWDILIETLKNSKYYY